MEVQREGSQGQILKERIPELRHRGHRISDRAEGAGPVPRKWAQCRKGMTLWARVGREPTSGVSRIPPTARGTRGPGGKGQARSWTSC